MPLRPFYVSSVDSGNLAAHLLTLRQGILALPDHKIVEPQLFEGINDTLRILIDFAEGIDDDRFIQLQKDLELAVNFPPITLTAAWQSLDRLTASAAKIENNFTTNPENQAAWWSHALAKQCRNALDELTFLAPWIVLPVSQDRNSIFPGYDKIPTLSELARLDTELLPVIGLSPVIKTGENEQLNQFRRLIIEASKHANERIATIKRLAKQSSFLIWSIIFCTTRHVTCYLLDTMLKKNGWTPVIMICWLRKQD
jgi:hypothetical protein